MRLRVIQVASGREWRGGERQTWLLARALAARADLEQVIVTRRDSELAHRATGAGLSVVETAWTLGPDPRACRAVLRALGPGPGIVHAHDAHALIVAGVAARLRGIPLIATRRVDFPLRRPGFWRRADRVLAVSDAVRRVLLASGIPAPQIQVVRSAVDTSPAVAPADLPGLLGLGPDAEIAITVGALVRHKDPDTLIRAAALLRDTRPRLHWVLVGDGPLAPALARQIRAASLVGRVHLLGRVADPLPLVAAAACFVASSRAEGLNTSILDALALGVPVVGTDAGGIPEALAGGAGLLVPRENPAALAGAVERVLGSPALRAALGAAARAARPRWSVERMAAEVLSVYRSLEFAR
jgi:glycosyltransferase involved in cell wall biosynthesis